MIITTAFVPAITRLCGYFSWCATFGGKLPAQKWRFSGRGGVGTRITFSTTRLFFGRSNVEKFNASIVAYSFDDEKWGYKKAVDRMMDYYSPATVKRIHLAPEDVGLDESKKEASAMETLHSINGWKEGIHALNDEFFSTLGRREVIDAATSYVRGLLLPLAKKNGWSLAEATGQTNPQVHQRLLRSAVWDHEELRRDRQDFIVEHHDDPGGILVFDETVFSTAVRSR